MKAFLGLIVWLLSFSSHAALITYSFSGTITSGSGTPQFAALVGEEYALTMVVDTADPDTDPNAQQGYYVYAIISATVTAGDEVFASVPGVPGSIQTYDMDPGVPLFDQVTFSRSFPGGLHLLLRFSDATGTALLDDSLPLSLNLNDFAFERSFSLSIAPGIAIGGDPTSASVVVHEVPEPGTFQLLCSILFAFALVQPLRAHWRMKPRSIG